MNQKVFINIIIIIGVVILVGIAGYFIMNLQTPSPESIPPSTKCDVAPDENGKCPEGCVNYGVPLGCVTEEYYKECQSGGKPCPICLAANTLIDTPSGAIPIQQLQKGMSVWTINKSGERIAGVVIETSKVSVAPSHRVVQLVLDDGRKLFVSPGHPTIDGRTVGDIVPNDLYDGARVVTADRVAYNEGATYDILPSGETGFYWANGILLDSTLH